eukprot:6488698-Amphidinium_carterae.1
MRELNRLTCEGTSSTLHRQVKTCLTKVNCGRAATVRAPLQDMNKRWCITDDEKTFLWQQHWCQLYGAKMASQERSFKTCKMPEQPLDVYFRPADTDYFNENEIRNALKHQMNGKSAADGLPTKVFRVLLDHLVPVWTRAYNCFVELGDVPVTYKGTQLFLVHKKSVTASPSDYRGLHLMLWSAKVLARALFVKMMANVHIALGQYGLGKNSGTDFPLLEMTQLQEWARTRKQRVALWFVDVRTAFDKVVRQVLSSPGSSVSLDALVQMGIDLDLAKQILIELQAHKPVLWDTGISEAHQRLLTSMLQHTWLVMPSGQGDSQLETHLGTPQGSSLSGLIYLLYQQSILTSVTQFLHENGLAIELRTPADNTLRVDAAPLQPVPVIAYHDDVVIPIKSDSAANLVVSARAVIEFTVPRYHGHNLMINWGKHR